MKKFGIALLFAAVVGLVAPVWGADKKNEGNNPIQEMYARFAKYKVDTYKRSKVEYIRIILTMEPTNGGKKIDFFMPEQDGATGKPVVWDDANKARMNALKVGQIYHLMYNIQGGSTYVCQAFEPYAGVPGEDEPNVYLFVQQGDLKGWPTVKTSKFKQDITFMLPAAKGPGKPKPDPKMLETLKQAKANDLLEIEAVGAGATPAIKTLKFWEPPKIGDIGSIAKNEKGFTTIEITDAVNSTTVVVPKNKMNLVGKIRPLTSDKAKSKSVLYRANPDEKDASILWLQDIKPTPDNYVAPTVASKNPADPGPAGTEKDGVFMAAGKTKAPISGEELDYIEIQTPGPDGGTLNEKYLISVKESAVVMPKAKDMKPGTAVTFRFTNDNQGKWMSDIKVKAAKPVEKKPAEAPKKADNAG